MLPLGIYACLDSYNSDYCVPTHNKNQPFTKPRSFYSSQPCMPKYSKWLYYLYPLMLWPTSLLSPSFNSLLSLNSHYRPTGDSLQLIHHRIPFSSVSLHFLLLHVARLTPWLNLPTSIHTVIVLPTTAKWTTCTFRLMYLYKRLTSLTGCAVTHSKAKSHLNSLGSATDKYMSPVISKCCRLVALTKVDIFLEQGDSS